MDIIFGSIKSALTEDQVTKLKLGYGDEGKVSDDELAQHLSDRALSQIDTDLKHQDDLALKSLVNQRLDAAPDSAKAILVRFLDAPADKKAEFLAAGNTILPA